MFLKRISRFDRPDNNNNKGAQRTLVVGGPLARVLNESEQVSTRSFCRGHSRTFFSAPSMGIPKSQKRLLKALVSDHPLLLIILVAYESPFSQATSSSCDHFFPISWVVAYESLDCIIKTYISFLSF